MDTKPKYCMVLRDNFHGISKAYISKINNRKWVDDWNTDESITYRIQEHIEKNIRSKFTSIAIQAINNGVEIFDNFIATENIDINASKISLSLSQRILCELVQHELRYFFEYVRKKEYSDHVSKFQIILKHLIDKEIMTFAYYC